MIEHYVGMSIEQKMLKLNDDARKGTQLIKWVFRNQNLVENPHVEKAVAQGLQEIGMVRVARNWCVSPQPD